MVKAGTCKHKEFVEFIFVSAPCMCKSCIWGAGLYAGVYGVLVMHRSIPAVPSPPAPQLTPRALEFLFLDGKFPGMGALKLPNAPWWGRRKRANALPPGWYVPKQHCSSFHSLHNSAPFNI